MSDSRTVIYVAATTAAAETGASELADAADGFEVIPVTTPDGVRDADCIVFAETPTTSEGATVLDVIEAADGTPLVLFTDSSFDPKLARSTDGVSGYVRRDAPDAISHLVDEIEWHASGERPAEATTAAEPAARHRRAAETLARDYARLVRDLRRETADRERFQRAFRAVPDPACAVAIGPATQPIVTAITDAFRDRFGLDPDRAVDAPVTDVFDAAGIRYDAERFRDAVAPDRREADGIVGEGRTEADDARAAPEPHVERGEPIALGTADGRVGTAADGETTIDGRVETGDGVCDLDITIIAARGSTPETRTGLIVCRDVTDHRRAERELAAESRRLEAIGDVLDEELREPLNVARGYLEVAEETGDPEHFAEVESAHDTLRAATDHLARLVGRDAIVVQRDAIELHELARRAWVAVDTGDASLELGPNGRFRGDPGRLRDVFEHLLAVATGDGATEAADSDAKSAVSVGATDDGFYIAGSAVADEADPFAGRTATADGTGLRLGRVESVADAHGWRVGVAEGEDGTAFAFRGVDVDAPE